MSYIASNFDTNCPESTEGTFPYSYRIEIDRKKNPAIGNTVTFIMIANGRPSVLADGGTLLFKCDQKRFEIPVEIRMESGERFEGVMTGLADGKDIHVVWDADPTSEALGVIKETTNNTVWFLEKPGAAQW